MVGSLRLTAVRHSRHSAGSTPTITATPNTIAWDGSSGWYFDTYVDFTIELPALWFQPLIFAIGYVV